MLAPELKTPNNLRRVVEDIKINSFLIRKGALGFIIGRMTITDGFPRCYFISLDENYEFDITQMSIEDIRKYFKQA